MARNATLRRAIIVHDLPQALAAFAAAQKLNQPVRLHTPYGAASCAGAGYFQKIAELAQRQYPDVDAVFVLDCGASPGQALGAIRTGWKHIRLDAKRTTLAKVADIAEQAGAMLDGKTLTLDLMEMQDPETAAIEWLKRHR
ncbi:class II fructose-bisphosphate aldolase [Rhodospirillaceae bacterium AH-315-P19]|nr:class II fructose-bisphosphate aldolase [Rhodospirillaceae bacterium AH-315-P19]